MVITPLLIIGFSEFIMLLAAFAIGLVLHPYSAAILEGIRAARDPSHRVTPQSPWVAFDRVVNRRLRHWRIFWICCIVCWFTWTLMPDSGFLAGFNSRTDPYVAFLLPIGTRLRPRLHPPAHPCQSGT